MWLGWPRTVTTRLAAATSFLLACAAGDRKDEQDLIAVLKGVGSAARSQCTPEPQPNPCKTEQRPRPASRRQTAPCAGRRSDRKSTRLNSSHLGISYAV